jgi:Protein of unknown function (DUF1572)
VTRSGRARFRNSIDNLILHLTGNLNYYIGAQIVGTGYIRHRDLEFSDCRKPKDELLSGSDEAMGTAIRTPAQSDRDWSTPYDAERADGSTRFAQILACAGHAYHHVGQVIYLRKELLRGSSADIPESKLPEKLPSKISTPRPEWSRR